MHFRVVCPHSCLILQFHFGCRTTPVAVVGIYIHEFSWIVNECLSSTAFFFLQMSSHKIKKDNFAQYQKCHLYVVKKLGYVAALGKDILLVISFPSKQKSISSLYNYKVWVQDITTLLKSKDRKSSWCWFQPCRRLSPHSQVSLCLSLCRLLQLLYSALWSVITWILNVLHMCF